MLPVLFVTDRASVFGAGIVQRIRSHVSAVRPVAVVLRRPSLRSDFRSDDGDVRVSFSRATSMGLVEHA
jgi:hypothetical protein